MASLRTSLRKQTNSGNKENETGKVNIVQSSAIKLPDEILEDKPMMASSATLKPNRNKSKRLIDVGLIEHG